MFNANNYGYNPYGNYLGQRPMQQPIQQSPVMSTQSPVISGLNGKQVDSIDVVKAMDIPMDGTISYFPLSDGSGIVTKQLGFNGASKITVYKPVEDEETKSPNFVTYDDLNDELKSLRKDIDKLKASLKEKDVKNE